jgi:hypothetical protein
MSVFSSFHSIAIGCLAALLGAGVGVWGHQAWMKRVARLKRRVPQRWPLVPRAVANTQERVAWLWMTRAFFDHAVMIKMPITRFTLPQTLEQGHQWYQLLSNAYCTFTVVDAGGRVIGCVDVASPLTNSKKSQILKQSLLDQCGIGYIVVDPTFLPETAEVRAEFLGVQAERHRAEHANGRAAVSAASDQLRASLHKQRQTRPSDRAPLSAESPSISKLPSELTTDDSHILHSWQNNSFLMPLDSRKAGLN